MHGPRVLCVCEAGVVSNGEHYQADVVVLAAALGIPDLVKPLGMSVPLTAKPRTVTLITKPMKRLLKHIVVTGRRLERALRHMLWAA